MSESDSEAEAMTEAYSEKKSSLKGAHSERKGLNVRFTSTVKEESTRIQKSDESDENDNVSRKRQESSKLSS